MEIMAVIYIPKTEMFNHDLNPSNLYDLTFKKIEEENSGEVNYTNMFDDDLKENLKGDITFIHKIYNDETLRNRLREINRTIRYLNNKSKKDIITKQERITRKFNAYKF